MPLAWWLTFKMTRTPGSTPTEIFMSCHWISDQWINTQGFSKKVADAYNKQYDAAMAAMKAEASARQELSRIHMHNRLSALIRGDDVEVQDLHDLFAWLQLKDRSKLGIQLVRFTKDDQSDGVVITVADFKNCIPDGFRPVTGSSYVFNFKLGRGMEYEDIEP